MEQVRLLRVLFLWDFSPCTGSSPSQTVPGRLAAGPGHRLRPPESPSSHRRKKGSERPRVRETLKRKRKMRRKGGRRRRRRGASLESERRIQAPRCNSCLRYASQSQLVPSSFWQAPGSGVHLARTHCVGCEEVFGLSATVSFRYSLRELGLLGTAFHNCGKIA